MPVICDEVAKAVPAVWINEKPVMAVESIGLTPISPVIAEGGTVLMPDFDRIAKLPAFPRFTGAWAALVSADESTTITATPRPMRTLFVPFVPARVSSLVMDDSETFFIIC